MLVNTVKLYKTPLSPNYQNVFDFELDRHKFATLRETFQEFLDVTYEPLIINLQQTRSIKSSDLLTSIVVPYDYITIREYNYLSIDSYYYFITDMESLNEGDTPSTRLTILWDSWSNNIDKLQDNKEILKAMIVCGHTNRFNSNGSPKYRPNLNKENILTKQEIYYHTEQLYQILYAKITFNEQARGKLNLSMVDTKFYSTTTGEEYTGNIKQSIPNYDAWIIESGRIVAYAPIGVLLNGSFIDNNSFRTTTEIYKHKGTDDTVRLENSNNLRTVIKNNGQEYAITENTNYIKAIELTYHSPYNISIENGEIVFDGMMGVLNLGDVSVNILMKYPKEFSHPSPNTGSSDVVYEMVNTDTRNYFNFKEEINIDYNSIFDTTLKSSATNPNSRFITGVEPKLHIYPFEYLEVICGDDSFIISPIVHNDNKFRITIDNRTFQPKYKLSRVEGNNEYVIKNIRNKFIDNNGLVTYSQDALDSYIIRNGAQKSTSVLLQSAKDGINIGNNIAKTLGSINSMGNSAKMNGGFTTDSVVNTVDSVAKLGTSIVDGVGNILLFEAMCKDMENTPSIYNNSDYSEDDIYYQDRVILVKHTSPILPSVALTDRNCYLYGYDYGRYETPLTNKRYWFDYVRTNNVNITFSLNNKDKTVISNILNNGVFKYHIRYNSNYEYIVDKDMSKDMSKNNVETYFVNTIESEVE